jgi:hypothetical protein
MKITAMHEPAIPIIAPVLKPLVFSSSSFGGTSIVNSFSITAKSSNFSDVPNISEF